MRKTAEIFNFSDLTDLIIISGKKHQSRANLCGGDFYEFVSGQRARSTKK